MEGSKEGAGVGGEEERPAKAVGRSERSRKGDAKRRSSHSREEDEVAEIEDWLEVDV